MKFDFKAKFKDGISKLTIKRVVIGVVVVLAFVAIFKSSFVQNKFFTSKTLIEQNTTIAKKGNLKVLVSGSGPIYFTNSSKIYSKIGATVTKVNYKEGDTVKAGDIIYELDDTDAQTSINTKSNSFKQNQISAGSSDDAVNNLSIKAPFTGLVSDIVVSQGDTVAKGGTVFTIADTTKLKVLLTYNSSAIGQISLGQSAKVYLTSLMQSVTGSVTYISNQQTATTVGGQLYTVEVQINNPGAVISGMTASADIQTSKGTVSSTGTAALNYIKKQTVVSLTGGTVESISVKQNQKVDSGQVLITMKNDDITRAKQNSDLQLENAKNEMNLNTKQLDNYKIIAPINGVVTKISNKVGDTIKAGDELSDVSNPAKMEFDIPVDELDIAKLKVGQKTKITVDALPATSKTPVTGEVSKIAVTGTSEGGVTTFIVTVKVNDNLDKLKGGMNANGEIEVSNKDNILYVPIEAITTISGKSFIYIKGAGSTSGGRSTMGGAARQTAATTTADKGNSKSEATVSTKIAGGSTSGSFSGKSKAKTNTTASKKQNYYDGSAQTEVQVGLNTDTSIEITSGLKEGDVIILPETKAASTTKSTSTASGGMGGGRAPGGGF
ncbi:HlyD family efflux transporter periplasmic adaptor subunit [Clostridium tagluense]|uniref:efflux RND transporter periplasmic adaptor subunit n=1 Tax=Clostridium tagluense TaxID=360422 RepID=UPI001C0E6AD3|nr:HlyD family efflux transporter periplasmic adaptor subunit [Clostridium tagluense]MBU3127184.1 HlyD family efflux transporter periplasmic adaptor subunit [Clostridium tagluense]MCB2312048.1 HlyD family efflux transporter periplasmic adaptor subunit [Clostridium tagluense]MCB2316635.1 HlyD family efflux transporter periplasmic adaptor subunit [Clostridium tagluense]MCB2321429.1 HlyD family efflux transporter periplasmic adaptor subunit [Clostridium tagluense]MCB2326441.1 HlyD family efflux t